MVKIATDLIGSPSVHYVNGHPEMGQSPIEGFDCSGFARFVLMKAGLFIPDYIGMDNVQRPIRHASEFWDHYGVSKHMPVSGDLVFFSRNGVLPTHMAVMIDEQTYVHAPGIDNSVVAIEKLTFEANETTNDCSRILYNSNPIGFKAPTIAIDHPTYRHHQQLL